MLTLFLFRTDSISTTFSANAGLAAGAPLLCERGVYPASRRFFDSRDQSSNIAVCTVSQVHVEERVMHGNYLWFRVANNFSCGKLIGRPARNPARNGQESARRKPSCQTAPFFPALQPAFLLPRRLRAFGPMPVREIAGEALASAGEPAGFYLILRRREEKLLPIHPEAGDPGLSLG